MRNFIVVTSVFEPTEAIQSFASNRNFTLIVVADRKTPLSWKLQGADFLSLESQQKEAGKLSKLLPYNHYSRKMLGYLRAVRDGADFIIDTDDDIYPKPNFSFPAHDGYYDIISRKGFINPYQYFSKEMIWPRGFPLHQISKVTDNNPPGKASEVRVGVWQGLSDKQPDVDAIFRLKHDRDFFFEKGPPIVLDRNTLSPFNSQNTCFRKAVFPLLYLPASVSFRFTDILRSYIAQPILWTHGFSLGFLEANTIQHRNIHDAADDFISEMPMYQHAGSISGIVQEIIAEKNSIGDNLFRSYEALAREKITGENELPILEAWLKECQA